MKQNYFYNIATVITQTYCCNVVAVMTLNKFYCVVDVMTWYYCYSVAALMTDLLQQCYCCDETNCNNVAAVMTD